MHGEDKEVTEVQVGAPDPQSGKVKLGHKIALNIYLVSARKSRDFVARLSIFFRSRTILIKQNGHVLPLQCWILLLDAIGLRRILTDAGLLRQWNGTPDVRTMLWADLKVEVPCQDIIWPIRVGSLPLRRLRRSSVLTDEAQIDDTPKHQHEM